MSKRDMMRLLPSNIDVKQALQNKDDNLSQQAASQNPSSGQSSQYS